jgi:hypothetical protein
MKNFGILALAAMLIFAILKIGRLEAADAPQLPPTFLSAVSLYDGDGRFVALATGKTRFHSCADALEDTRSALEKALSSGPENARAIGLCIPLHTYNVADLIG